MEQILHQSEMLVMGQKGNVILEGILHDKQIWNTNSVDSILQIPCLHSNNLIPMNGQG